MTNIEFIAIKRRYLLSTARRIEVHIEKVWEHMRNIRDSDHPIADVLYETIKEELGITSTNVPDVMERMLDEHEANSMTNHIHTASMSTPCPGALAAAQPAADTDREAVKHTPTCDCCGRTMELNGVRFCCDEQSTLICHIDDYPLYASAPDLLLERDRLKQDCANLREALEEVVRCWGRDDDDWIRGDMDAAIRQARDVIKEAETK